MSFWDDDFKNIMATESQQSLNKKTNIEVSFKIYETSDGHCEMKMHLLLKKLQISNPDPIDAVSFYITECRVSDASNYINVLDEGCPIEVLNEWL